MTASDSSELNMDRSTFPTERYEPIKLLGKGALGEVYLAKDKTLGRTVAVKCLLTVTDEQVVAFHREARIASRLSHSSVISSLDFGTTDSGRPYLALEYFEGVSLEQLLERQGHLSEELVTHLFLVVANALSYIHSQGVLHRDLKPSNILLKYNGDLDSIEIRIIDFGLSSIKEEFQTKTLMQGRTLVGTPLYMSPDQIGGGVYDARSEVYSLGCLMFEAITGSPPFPGELALEILEHHLSTEPPMLRDVRPDKEYSLGIQRIIRRCLAKAKEDRFQTMNELAEALENKESLNETGLYTRGESKSRFSSLTLVACCAFCLIAGVVLVMVALGEFPSTEKKKPSTRIKLDDVMSNPLTALDKPDEPLSFAIQSEHVAGDKSVFFWGEESVERLKALSESGKEKETVTFRGVPLTSADIDYLLPIKPKVAHFYRCVFKGGSDAFRHLAKVESLETIGLHECELSPEQLSQLKVLPRFNSIVVENCNINDSHLTALAKLTHVQRFVLDGNPKITVEGIKRLSNKSFPIAVWANEGQFEKVSSAQIQKLKQEFNILLVTKAMESVVNRQRDRMFNEELLHN